MTVHKVGKHILSDSVYSISRTMPSVVVMFFVLQVMIIACINEVDAHLIRNNTGIKGKLL